MDEKRRGLSAPLSIHHLTIYHCHQRAYRRRGNSRPHDCRRVHAPVLAPVRLCQAKTKKFDGYIFFNQ